MEDILTQVDDVALDRRHRGGDALDQADRIRAGAEDDEELFIHECGSHGADGGWSVIHLIRG